MTKKQEMELALRGEGCLGRSADDEPVFILTGRDPVAAAVVLEWADRREALGLNTPEERAKIAEARAHAFRMHAWPKHPKFAPPPPRRGDGMNEEPEDDGSYMWERCYSCGHRLRFSADGCPKCGIHFDGRADPEPWPDVCECPRCCTARESSHAR